MRLYCSKKKPSPKLGDLRSCHSRLRPVPFSWQARFDCCCAGLFPLAATALNQMLVVPERKWWHSRNIASAAKMCERCFQTKNGIKKAQTATWA